jgi:hypothetical protein
VKKNTAVLCRITPTFYQEKLPWKLAFGINQIVEHFD